jgi:hypothetical protein
VSKAFSAAFIAVTSASILLHITAVDAATEKVLYSFCSQSGCADGEYPYASVVRVKGELYATTNTGANGNNGTIVSVNRKNTAALMITAPSSPSIWQPERRGWCTPFAASKDATTAPTRTQA